MSWPIKSMGMVVDLGHQARVVALGGIAKRFSGGLITSQPSHFCEMLVGNAVTTGHHARTVSSNYPLEKKKQ
jgi:hypothetical protein